MAYRTAFEIIGKLISINNNKATFSVEIEVEIPIAGIEDVKRFMTIGQKLGKCYVINISCLQNRVLHTTELVGRVFQNAV